MKKTLLKFDNVLNDLSMLFNKGAINNDIVKSFMDKG